MDGGRGNDTYVFWLASSFETDTVIELAAGGADTLDFSSFTTGVTVNFTSDTALATMANRKVVTGAGGQAANFENVSGGSGNDSVTLQGISGATSTVFNVHGNGGTDTLMFTGTSGDETATLRPGRLDVTGSNYAVHADSVETVRVYGGGGTNDRVYLYDSAGNDSFVATPTSSYLTGTGFYNSASGFRSVYAYATAGNAGGGDRAFLYDSAGNDSFVATPTHSYLTGTGFYNDANGFGTVYAYATAGDAGGVGDRAFLYDSAGNDSFYGRSGYGYLKGLGFYNYVGGFDKVYAYANAGGTDTLNVRALDYYFSKLGTWENIL